MNKINKINNKTRSVKFELEKTKMIETSFVF